MRSRASVELVLLVPGLLGPAAAGPGDREAARALVAGLDLDGLDRLLARAGHAAGTAVEESLEALAFRAFGHAAPPAGTDWPVAALTALVDLEADEGSGFRLRADPVHLRADIDDLVLFDASGIDLSPDEAVALARTVNDALGPHGPRIDAAHPHRWYVAPDAPARIATTPLSRAAGARVFGALPRGPDAARWHRWMNEVQMALHECPVNVERERRGAAPVNSVWVWGAGSLPPAGDAPAPFVRVWTDDALLRGLARHAGVECGASAASANPASANPASANPARRIRPARIRPARRSGWAAIRDPARTWPSSTTCTRRCGARTSTRGGPGSRASAVRGRSRCSTRWTAARSPASRSMTSAATGSPPPAGDAFDGGGAPVSRRESPVRAARMPETRSSCQSSRASWERGRPAGKSRRSD